MNKKDKKKGRIEAMQELDKQMEQCQCEEKLPILLDMENNLLIFQCAFCGEVYISQTLMEIRDFNYKKQLKTNFDENN